MFAALITLISACGAAPATPEDIASTQQALTPAVVEMWATHMMAPPVPGVTIFRISDDASHPTPNFTQLQVTQTVGLPDVYSTTFKTARGTISAADWATMSTDLNNGHTTGSWTKIRITYDNSVAGDQKPWTPPGIQFFLCVGIGTLFGPNCG